MLQDLVTRHRPITGEALRFTPCPTGLFNTTWFVDGAQTPLVLRIAPPDDRSRMLFYEYRMIRQEPEIHARLQAATDIPVPAILAYDNSRELIDRDYLLMTRLPGRPLSERSDLTRDKLDRTLRDVGRALAQAHAIHNEEYGYIGPHAPMLPQATWVRAFEIMWNKLLDDIRQCGGYTQQEMDRMRSLFERHRGRFDHGVPASLLHMDVWAQNILADDAGQMTGLLDWDRAVWGDPEIEFAVLDYCGISQPAFWEGYGQVRDSSPSAEIRRLFYLLYELQKYIVIRRVRDGDPDGADTYRRQSLQLTRSLH